MRDGCSQRSVCDLKAIHSIEVDIAHEGFTFRKLPITSSADLCPSIRNMTIRSMFEMSHLLCKKRNRPFSVLRKRQMKMLKSLHMLPLTHFELTLSHFKRLPSQEALSWRLDIKDFFNSKREERGLRRFRGRGKKKPSDFFVEVGLFPFAEDEMVFHMY